MIPDITDLQPGQTTDAVESLARAIHESSAYAMATMGRTLYVGDLSESRPQRPFDEEEEWLKQGRREQAKFLLERMNR